MSRLRRRKSGSQLTLRWREVDSNHRFLVRRSNRDGRRAWRSRKGSGSVGEPKVRIQLPPPGSQQRTGSPRAYVAQDLTHLDDNGVEVGRDRIEALLAASTP